MSFLAASWAVPSARTSAQLLAHEQGHFDITGLVARDMAARLLDLRVYGPELMNANDPIAATNALDKKVKRVSRRAEALWNFLQQGVDCLYDTDTGHGANAQGQQEWNALLTHVKNFNLGFEDTLIARGFIRIVADPPGGTPTYG